jgi:uncharacterized RDD family membrane protein YckC
MEKKFNRLIEIITPENIALQMPLATPYHRLEAFLNDVLRLVLFTILLSLLIVLLSNLLPLPSGGTFIMLAIFNILLFLLWNGYFIYYELKYGATPGKRSLGFKVISQNGSFLPASAIYVRNIMREIELWMPMRLLLAIAMIGPNAFSDSGLWPFLWILMFGVFPFIDKYHRRLGDLLSGTVVVMPGQSKLERDLVVRGKPIVAKKEEEEEASQPPKYHFSEAMVDIYGKDELQILEEILRKSPKMLLRDRKELFRTLVQKICKKVNYPETIPCEEYELFLNLFYEAQRANLENKLVHGRSLERRTRKQKKKQT